MDAFDAEDPFADRSIDYNDDSPSSESLSGEKMQPIRNDRDRVVYTGSENSDEDVTGSSSESEFVSTRSGPFSSAYTTELLPSESDYTSDESENYSEGFAFTDQRRPRLTRLQLTWHLSYRECCNQFDLSSRDWNEEFQCLLEEAELDVHCNLASKRRLQNLLNDFDELTRGIVRRFVDKGLVNNGNLPLPDPSGISGTGVFPVCDIGLVPLRVPNRLREAQHSPGKQGQTTAHLRLQDVKTVSQLRRWRKERIARAEDSTGKVGAVDGGRQTKKEPSDYRNPISHRCFRTGNVFLQKWITDREVACARGIQSTFRAMLVSRVAGIYFPLCALHTYRGVTFTALALIPLGRNAKNLHAADVHPDVPLFAAAHQLVRTVGLSVNLMPFNVGLRQLKVPGMEVIEAPDTRIYCVNAVGLLPPLFDDVGSMLKRRLDHVVKGSALASFMHSPDHAYERSCEQVSRVLPKLIRNILLSPEGAAQVLATEQTSEQAEALVTGRGFVQTNPTVSLSQRVIHSLLQGQIVKLFHASGVNLCLMGEVHRSFFRLSRDPKDIQTAVSSALSVEMISRTAKRFFYRELHRSIVFAPILDVESGQQGAQDCDYSNANMLHILSRLLGTLFPSHSEGVHSQFIFTFVSEVGRKFGFNADDSSDEVFRAVQTTLRAPQERSRIIRRVCDLCGISLASGTIQKVSLFSSSNNFSVAYAALSRSDAVTQILDGSKDNGYSPEYFQAFVLPNRVRLFCQRGDYSQALRDSQRILAAFQKNAQEANDTEMSKLVVAFDNTDASVIQWIINVASIMGLHLRRFDEAIGLLDSAVRVLAELGKRSEEIALVTSAVNVQGGKPRVKVLSSTHRITLFVRQLIHVRNCQGRLMQEKGDLQKAKGYFFEGLRIAKERLPKESQMFASSLILGGLRGLLDIAQTPIGALLVDVKLLRVNTIGPFLAKMRPSSSTHALLEQTGSVLLHAGELLIASECLEQAAAQSRTVYGSESQEFATDLNLWAFALMRSDINKFGSRCELLMTQAMLLIEKISGSFSVNHMTAINNLGALQIALKRYVRASRLFNDAFSMCVKSTPVPGRNEQIGRKTTRWISLEPEINSLKGRRAALSSEIVSTSAGVGLDHPVARQIEDNLLLLRKSFRSEAILLIQRRWRAWRDRQRQRELLGKTALCLQRAGRGFIRREALRAELSPREMFPFYFGVGVGLISASSSFVSKCPAMGRNWNADLQHLLGNVGSYCSYREDGYLARKVALEKLNREFSFAAVEAVRDIEIRGCQLAENVALGFHIQNILVTRLGEDSMAEHMACSITLLYRLLILCDVPFLAAPITVSFRSPRTGFVYLCQSVLPLGKQVEYLVTEGSVDVARSLTGMGSIDYIESRKWHTIRYHPSELLPSTSDVAVTCLKHIFSFLNCGGDIRLADDEGFGLCLPKIDSSVQQLGVGGDTFPDESFLLKCISAIEVIHGSDGRFYLTNPMGLAPGLWRPYSTVGHSALPMLSFSQFGLNEYDALGFVMQPSLQLCRPAGSYVETEHLIQSGVVSVSISKLTSHSVQIGQTPFSWVRAMARLGRASDARKRCEEWLTTIPEIAESWEVNGEYHIVQRMLAELHLVSDSFTVGVSIMHRVVGYYMQRRRLMCSGIRLLDFVARACIRTKDVPSARRVYLDALLACDYLRLSSAPTHRGDLMLIPLVGLLQCSESDNLSMFEGSESGALSGKQLFAIVQIIREKSWLSSRIVAVFHEFTRHLLRQKQYDVSSAISAETCRAAREVHGFDSLQHVKALTTESQVYFSWDQKLFWKECREPLETAVSILERIAPRSQQLGSICNNLGFLLMQQRNYFAARFQYSKAETILRECLEGGSPDEISAREISKIRRNMAVVNARITTQCVVRIQAAVRGWIIRRSRAERDTKLSPRRQFQDKLQNENSKFASVEQRDRMLVQAHMEVEFERLTSRAHHERSVIERDAFTLTLAASSSSWLTAIRTECFTMRDLWWVESVLEPTRRMALQASVSSAVLQCLSVSLLSAEKIERRRIERSYALAWRTGTIFAPGQDFSAAAINFSTFLIARYMFEANFLFNGRLNLGVGLSAGGHLDRHQGVSRVGPPTMPRPSINLVRARTHASSPPPQGITRFSLVSHEEDARLLDTNTEPLSKCIVYERNADHEALQVPFRPAQGPIHWLTRQQMIPLNFQDVFT